MKQIAQYQDGRLELQEVPLPTPPPGGLLVRTTHSVISVGTERMKVEQARMNLLQKARARPDQVRKVMDTARNLGWRAAMEKVRNRLETPTPLGYSAAGIVEAVGAGQTRFRVGDRVVCAGAECAFHSEYNAVPEMLAAGIPAGVENWQAAYTTIASIALQAIRQLEPSLGDRVLVLGQGLIGLLASRFLGISGARVMAVDIAESRRELSLAMGAESMIVPSSQDLANEVRLWTDGYGVDSVVVCTASGSNGPIEQAAASVRDRGRIVIVGNTHADLDWKVFYEKELEVRYSRSYGPGRYDPAYEWGGSDYPIGYVRWTEQRNFEACLELMRTGALDVSRLTTRRAPFSEAVEVYRSLMTEGSREVGVVLEYGRTQEGRATPPTPPPSARTSLPAKKLKLENPVRSLDVVGAGNFARTMLLPHLKGQISLETVVNHTALSAQHVRQKFGFAKASTTANDALGERSAAALLVATRHHLHAEYVLQGLAQNRHIFVEKPLCLTREELDRIGRAISSSGGSVMVGFNRRFAPASDELRRQLSTAPGPKSASFRVMAGRLDPQHWYANYAESGGRVVGEACHFLDYFGYLFQSDPVRVFGQTTWPAQGRLAFPDSVAFQVEFADGSCGQLIYSAEGDSSYPKEVLTVFAAGMVAEVVNFQRLTVHRNRRRQEWKYQSKGHAEEMKAWLGFLRGDQAHPLAYEEADRSMRIVFDAVDALQRNAPPASA